MFGAAYDDRTTIEFASQMEREFSGFVRSLECRLTDD
jgi:hypothetical protein